MKNHRKQIWIINQFANTIEMPGHTRQYGLAKYLTKNRYKTTVFFDFNLSLRNSLKKRKS